MRSQNDCGGLLGGILCGITGILGGAIGGLEEGLHDLIDGVERIFYAPNQSSPYALHVQRRVMRYCTEYQRDPNCDNNWKITNGTLPPAPLGVNVGNKFPSIEPFKPTAVPLYNLVDALLEVPAQILGSLIDIVFKLPQEAIDAIKSNCPKDSCKQQTPSSINSRATIAEFLSALQYLTNPDKPQSEIDQLVETQMVRTFQCKQLLFNKAGIGEIVYPADNGLYCSDVLLSEQQANTIINLLNSTQNHSFVFPPHDSSGRRKRAGDLTYFKIQPSEQWPIGQAIPYAFDTNLSDDQKDTIRAAIQEIQSKTCLQFQELASLPNTSCLYYILYPQNQYCGISYIGRQSPTNPIFLSFLCPNMTGVAVHETFHSLGAQHEHVRPDRDTSLAVNYSNIDPQLYDVFATSNPNTFTTYGNKYDYGSVMHYASGAGAREAGLQTMSALVDPATNNALMGQRVGLSQTDVDALMKMYCFPQDCDDNNVYCGEWTNQGLCMCGENLNCWMLENCRSSCNFCRCTSNGY